MVRRWNTLRLYFQDTWRLRRGLTLNYGLGWSVDRNLNYDLRKPTYLARILAAGAVWDPRPNNGRTLLQLSDSHGLRRRMAKL